MKTYILEPTYKKSVCEVELWRKIDTILSTDNDDNWYTSWNGPILRKECWWRWGEFTLEIPETEEEIDVFLNEKGFGTLEEYLEYQGVDIDCSFDENENENENENGDAINENGTKEKKHEDKHKKPKLEDTLLQYEEEDEHVLPPEADCNYCWDGQGTDFNIATTRNSRNMTDEEKKEMKDEATRVYCDEEMYEEGLEMLGWEHYSTIYEVHCAMTVTLQETDEEKMCRELKEFQTKFQKDLEDFPETLGNIFETQNDNDGASSECGATVHTAYRDAVKKFGTNVVLEMMDGYLLQSADKIFLYDDGAGAGAGVGASSDDHLPPYMVAASCPNCDLEVIYHFLRNSPSLEGYFQLVLVPLYCIVKAFDDKVQEIREYHARHSTDLNGDDISQPGAGDYSVYQLTLGGDDAIGNTRFCNAPAPYTTKTEPSTDAL